MLPVAVLTYRPYTACGPFYCSFFLCVCIRSRLFSKDGLEESCSEITLANITCNIKRFHYNQIVRQNSKICR